MPYKDSTALKAWREKNREKIRAKDRRGQTQFWKNHERPKASPFDLVENRRRIKALKILGIHLVFAKIPTLVQNASACIDCGNKKRFVVLDTVTVKLPRIILKLPYERLDEKGDSEQKIANFKTKHCEHYQFDDSEIARRFTHDFKPQCYCDFSQKRRITFDAFLMEAAFCYDCLQLHFEDYNFQLCQRCVPKLLKSVERRKAGVLRPRFRSPYETGVSEEMDASLETSYCKMCLSDIAGVALKMKVEELEPEREAYNFLDARSALEKTAFLDDLTLTPEQIVRALEGVDLRPIPKVAQLERESEPVENWT